MTTIGRLHQAARDAAERAGAFARCRFDPGMPLQGWLRVVRDTGAAAVPASSVAHRLGELAGSLIADPGQGPVAVRDLQLADRHLTRAADRFDAAFELIRVALKRSGVRHVHLDGLGPVPSADRALMALYPLSETAGGVRDLESVYLGSVAAVARFLADVAECFCLAGRRMPDGITAAGERQLRRELVPGARRAAALAGEGAREFKVARRLTRDAASVIADAHARQQDGKGLVTR